VTKSTSIEIIPVDLPQHLEAVRQLWTRYWNELGFTPCFQDFSAELTALPGKYASPDGRILIALEGQIAAGAVAFRKLDEVTCEAKRLFVSPEFRAFGLGRHLMMRLIAGARAAGYQRMVADTMPVMSTALAMYERLGFRRRPPYDGSTDGAICIELIFT
jgi:putative acetyltransferase